MSNEKIVIPKNTKYTLSIEEMAFARQVAATRSGDSRANNVTDARQSTVESSTEIDIKGAVGEVAFVGMLRQHGVYNEDQYMDALALIADRELRTAASGADFGDAIIKNKTVDVKSTHYTSGHLAVASWKKMTTKIDAYALMIGDHEADTPEYTFAGICTPDVAHAHNGWVDQRYLSGMSYTPE